MSNEFRAIVAEAQDGKTTGILKTLTAADLPDEDVLIDVAYSTVNYKDGLAVTGASPICRRTPLVCGIDLSGVVRESRDPAWKAGDRVLVNGYGLSENYHGGYSQQQRVKGSFLVRVPEAFSLQQAMALGTAGYTAMLCVNAIRDHGITPADGTVVVSGAGGGVGSVAIMLLAKLGYTVAAVTGRPELGDYLKSIGASEIVPREDLARDGKPIEKERWAAGVDNVGANTLATMLAQTQYEGLVAACGLAGGVGLPTTVMPFILRGVTLRGIDSVQAAMPRRLRAWADLAELIDASALAAATQVKPLAEVPALAKAILAGQVQGRVVIDVNA
ncbi:MAG: oxidoreductase [Gammaproteobacteria bacterium]|jgi:acrylyl-CoA reductase (NADPH)|nr:oxidoreductase [Gammaproteobacteria bacterium]